MPRSLGVRPRRRVAKPIFAALAVVAGIAVAFQGATTQGLLKSAGIGPALVVNTVVVLIGATGLCLVTGAKTTFFPAGARHDGPPESDRRETAPAETSAD